MLVRTILICLLFFNLGALSQEAGDLDESWDNDGILLIKLHNTNLYSQKEGQSCIMLSDGKIISAGFKEDASLFIVKVNRDGELDDFGNEGNHFCSDTFPSSEFRFMERHKDDEILIALASKMFSFDSNGNPDTGFCNGGSLLMNPLSFDCIPVKTGDAYNYLIAGSVLTIPRRAALTLYNDEGNLNANFGDEGVSFIDLHHSGFKNIDFGADSLIYASGIPNNEGEQILVACFTKHGFLNESFGENGYILLNGPAGGSDIKVTSQVYNKNENKVTIAGFYIHPDGDNDIYACQLNANGSLNAAFGINGWSYLRRPESDDRLYDIEIQADGKIYFSGSINKSEEEDILLGRLLTSGYLDDDFGTNGLVITDLGGHEFGNELLLDSPNLFLSGVVTDNEYFSTKFILKYHTCYDPSGEEENHHDSFPLIYPIPFADHFYCEVPGELKTNNPVILKIFSCAGQLVFSSEFNPTDKRIKVQGYQLPKGTYYLSLYVGDKVFNKKLISIK